MQPMQQPQLAFGKTLATAGQQDASSIADNEDELYRSISILDHQHQPTAAGQSAQNNTMIKNLLLQKQQERKNNMSQFTMSHGHNSTH